MKHLNTKISSKYPYFKIFLIKFLSKMKLYIKSFFFPLAENLSLFSRIMKVYKCEFVNTENFRVKIFHSNCNIKLQGSAVLEEYVILFPNSHAFYLYSCNFCD